MAKKNAFYAQSGGVTAVINASACGVIEACRRNDVIGILYAGQNGIIGALKENLIDTSLESDEAIAAISEDGYGITQQARDYMLPLIAGENYSPYKDGMPCYPALKNKLIAKRCKQWTLP